MNRPFSVEPMYLLGSFLVIAVHYVVLFVSLLLGMLLIAWIGYPDVYELWNLPPEQRPVFQNVWENSPERFFPAGLCWWLMLVGLAVSILLGYSVAWWAPFSRSGHGVFLAIVCIVSFLQISLTQPQLPKWMMMGLLIASPVGVVTGSRWGDRRWGRPRNEEGDRGDGTG